MGNFSRKNISLVFSKKMLVDNLTEISDSLESFLNNVTNEEDLVTSDNLARGELIEPVSISARYVKVEKGARWDLLTYPMAQSYQEDHPAEYWGDLGLYQRDFMASTTKYPWMPSDVSSFDI
jgi:hypothetical protein